MIRERTMRVFSLLVLVAGSAAILNAAGAGWNDTRVVHAPAAVAAPMTHATPRAPTTTAARRAAIVPARATAQKRASKPAFRLSDLPRSYPASVLPAGGALPTLAAPPSDPWAARQPTRLGQIVIPKIGLDQPFFEGVDQAAFAHGAGHWPGSPEPGGWGNSVFGGHRVTEARPFYDMDKLGAGDEIKFVMPTGWTYVYRVTRVFVVPQSAMWITDQSPGRTLTIFTCHPKGSASERLVTKAVLSRIVAAA
jgi:LPXTG-site transpeptidase (sortase) family protein